MKQKRPGYLLRCFKLHQEKLSFALLRISMLCVKGCYSVWQKSLEESTLSTISEEDSLSWLNSISLQLWFFNWSHISPCSQICIWMNCFWKISSTCLNLNFFSIYIWDSFWLKQISTVCSTVILVHFWLPILFLKTLASVRMVFTFFNYINLAIEKTLNYGRRKKSIVELTAHILSPHFDWDFVRGLKR